VVLGPPFGPGDPFNKIFVTLAGGVTESVHGEDKAPPDDAKILSLPVVVPNDNVEARLSVIVTQDPLIGPEEHLKLVIGVPRFTIDEEEMDPTIVEHHELLDPVDTGGLCLSAREVLLVRDHLLGVARLAESGDSLLV